jgi:YjgF/chorismate_mutase-like, putative endoribonuclease
VGFVNAAPGFVQAPAVLDGASRLLLDAFGPERGRHTRMALCHAGLPGDAPLTAELLLAIGRPRDHADRAGRRPAQPEDPTST